MPVEEEVIKTDEPAFKGIDMEENTWDDDGIEFEGTLFIGIDPYTETIMKIIDEITYEEETKEVVMEQPDHLGLKDKIDSGTESAVEEQFSIAEEKAIEIATDIAMDVIGDIENEVQVEIQK